MPKYTRKTSLMDLQMVWYIAHQVKVMLFNTAPKLFFWCSLLWPFSILDLTHNFHWILLHYWSLLSLRVKAELTWWWSSTGATGWTPPNPCYGSTLAWRECWRVNTVCWRLKWVFRDIECIQCRTFVFLFQQQSNMDEWESNSARWRYVFGRFCTGDVRQTGSGLLFCATKGNWIFAIASAYLIVSFFKEDVELLCLLWKGKGDMWSDFQLVWLYKTEANRLTK